MLGWHKDIQPVPIKFVGAYIIEYSKYCTNISMKNIL